MSKTTILPQLRRLITDSGMNPTELSGLAVVNYQNLRRFMLGLTENYNIREAEMVHYALTGKTFSTPSLPLKKSLRKGRAA